MTVSMADGLTLLNTDSAPLPIKTYTVAAAPAAASNTSSIIYVSNGAGGNPVLAFSDGTNWLRCDTLATIAAI